MRSILLDVTFVLGLLTCVSAKPADLGFPSTTKNVKHAMIAVTIEDDDGAESPANSTIYHGLYGQRSLTSTVSGHLVHVRSRGNVNDGCSDYDHDLPTHDWIALIERGTCYFSEKVRVATTQYNASGVIVYNNGPDPHPISMQAYVTDQVYVFVIQSVGRKLALLTDSNEHVHVNITYMDIGAAGTVRPLLSYLPFLALHIMFYLIVSLSF